MSVDEIEKEERDTLVSSGRHRGSKRKASNIDFKTLAGETYIDDDDENNDDSVTNSTDMDGNEKSVRMSLYANKHIHEVLHRTYHPTEDVLQTVTDGSILTAANIIDPNHTISIHRPILVKDTPKKIGMKLPKTSNGSTSSCNNTGSTSSSKPPTIRELGSKIGMKHPLSVMDVRSQDELEGWNWSDMVDYFEDEDRKCISNQHQSILLSAMEPVNASGPTLLPTCANSPSSTTSSNASPSKSILRRKRKNLPRVLNQISLEFSNLPLAKHVRSPTFVRELDWIDHIWPSERKKSGDYPRVQYYCLTSTAGCYTDFHIDFGGTSVWYHLISGRKTFLLIPPTKTNLELYEAWLCRKDQNDIFFLDMTKQKKNTDVNVGKNVGGSCTEISTAGKGENGNEDDVEELKVEQCIRVTLEQGQTFVIPTGWIHAVHTPVDSIVFGGNFLHGLDIEGQLNIYCLETRTRVPAKFRFPSFVQLMYYAGREYFKRLKQLNDITANNNDAISIEVSKVELEGIRTLMGALRTWTVSPGGDTKRFGSVAHVELECVSSLGSLDVSNMNDLLDRLEVEIEKHEQTLRDGVQSNVNLRPVPSCAPTPRLKLSIKRKLSPLAVPATKSPATPIASVPKGKKEVPEIEEKRTSPASKLKLKLCKAVNVPSLSSTSIFQKDKGSHDIEKKLDDCSNEDDEDFTPAFTFKLNGSDVKKSQSLSLMQPPSNEMELAFNNTAPGSIHVSNMTRISRNKDLTSRHNGMDDDEWLPNEDTTVAQKKHLFQYMQRTTENKARTQSSINNSKVPANQKKKPKATGGGARSRLMKKLKF